jgi:hypothetical protein
MGSGFLTVDRAARKSLRAYIHVSLPDFSPSFQIDNSHVENLHLQFCDAVCVYVWL